MSEQKALKKRLKALMALPQNQICSDCPEKKPTWASLIVPPPGAPPGTQSIGAFCCLECSGSHRRLGVHISFVRSVNLDSCTSTTKSDFSLSLSFKHISNIVIVTLHRESTRGTGNGEWREC